MNAIIYIINLDKAVERKKSMEEQLLKTNIPFEFVSAINKDTVNTIKHKVGYKYKRPLVPNEVACFLSHYKVKEQFLKTDYDFAIILEDDLELLDHFDKLIKKVMEQYPSLPKKQQWDVLKLSFHGKKKLFKLKDIDPYYSLQGGSVAITTMGAIWTRKGAKNFLNKAIKNEQVIINMPIDCALQEPWKYHLKIYNIVPHIIGGKDFGSQIRPTERLKSSFYARIRYELRKALPRLYFYLKTGWLKY